MRCLVAGLLFLSTAAVCSANDTRVVGQGGRVRRVSGERTTVRMVRESVRIDIYRTYYDVDATFLFQNEGPPVTVTMGFPERGGGDIREKDYKQKSGFLRFGTWVDRQPVHARRQPAAIGREGQYKAFWVKEVSFAQGQGRAARVRYRSKAHEVSNGERFAMYDFTGGNWRGTVEESELLIEMHTPGTCLAWADGASLKRTGNQFLFRRKNWQAEAAVKLTYMSTLPGWLVIGRWPEGYAPPKGAVTLTQPARAASLDWAPLALIRDGTTLVQLKTLKRLLDRQAEKAGHQRRAAISWEPNTKETVLQAGAHVLHFRPGLAEMLIDGRGKVPLAAGPFVSRPAPGDPQGALYVPLRPVVEALGGTCRVERSARRVYIDLPPFWGAAGKPPA